MADQHSGKFSIIPARVYDDPRVDLAAVRVLGLIGCYSDRGGWCYPSLSTLAARVGLSKQAIAKQIATLERLGYIEKRAAFKENGAKLANRYRIIFDVFTPDYEPTGDFDHVDYDDHEVDTHSTSEVDRDSTSEVDRDSTHKFTPVLTSQENAPIERVTKVTEPCEKTARTKNPHWDALAEGVGYQPRTKTERALFASCARELADAGYTPAQITHACTEHRRAYTYAPTPTSIRKHISALLASTPAHENGRAGAQTRTHRRFNG